jgi:hypothetical protein
MKPPPAILTFRVLIAAVTILLTVTLVIIAVRSDFIPLIRSSAAVIGAAGGPARAGTTSR